jgi:hypothetical protein
MNSEPNQPDSETASNLFGDYDRYAKVLRAWFVAYGVGGPVLLLTNEAVRDKIADSRLVRCIAFHLPDRCRSASNDRPSKQDSALALLLS